MPLLCGDWRKMSDKIEFNDRFLFYNNLEEKYHLKPSQGKEIREVVNMVENHYKAILNKYSEKTRKIYLGLLNKSQLG